LSNINLFSSDYIKKVHFTGIGGISMSGLAEILLNLGYIITGSDAHMSSITDRLSSMGVKIYEGHAEKNIAGSDLVIFTAAVKSDNPEIINAKKQNIPIMERSTLLGQVMEKYKHSINIAGTHGKTTTTSMISTIMINTNANPTIHLGGELNSIGGSTKIGSSDLFITEACEYVDSFLKFHPTIAVILNIDTDHLDYFKDIEHIIESFTKFINLVPENGYVVLNNDDPNSLRLKEHTKCNVVTFGIKETSSNWTANNITFNSIGHPSYDLYNNGKKLCPISLSVPGLHNVYNSLAAIAATNIYGIDIAKISETIIKFTGTKRRFEYKGTINGVKIIDDYAHHPSEVLATLNAAKNADFQSVWCVFQPHTYSRTKNLLNEFSNAFHSAEHIIITDIYAAREKKDPSINSQILTNSIKDTGANAIYISDFNEIVDYLKANIKEGDVVLTIGAGDIYKVGDLLLSNVNT